MSRHLSRSIYTNSISQQRHVMYPFAILKMYCILSGCGLGYTLQSTLDEINQCPNTFYSRVTHEINTTHIGRAFTFTTLCYMDTHGQWTNVRIHSHACTRIRKRTCADTHRRTNIQKHPQIPTRTYIPIHIHVDPRAHTCTHAQQHTHNYATCLINGFCLLHRAIFTIKEDTHITKYQHNIKKMLRGNPL